MLYPPLCLRLEELIVSFITWLYVPSIPITHSNSDASRSIIRWMKFIKMSNCFREPARTAYGAKRIGYNFSYWRLSCLVSPCTQAWYLSVSSARLQESLRMTCLWKWPETVPPKVICHHGPSASQRHISNLDHGLGGNELALISPILAAMLSNPSLI